MAQQSTLDPIDLNPKIEFDHEDLIEKFSKEKTRIDDSRSQWLDLKLEYLDQWDNFLTDQYAPYGKSKERSDDSLHIPLIFEKSQVWQSRMYNTIFAIEPFFMARPLSKVTKTSADSVRKVMDWYLTTQINKEEGIKPVIDELLWDMAPNGWACLYKSWEKIQRKFKDVQKLNMNDLAEEAEEIRADLAQKGRPRRPVKEYREVSRMVTIFDGIMLKSIPQEDMYFPEYIPTSGDMDHPKMIFVELGMDEQELRTYQKMGLYEKEAVDIIIESGRGFDDPRKNEIRKRKQELAGLNPDLPGAEEPYQMFAAFYREDLDGDGYPEEYMSMVSLKAKQIARTTYLDRICYDGKRPIYKFDLFKRPRSAYSRGFAEMLYPYNREIDDIHNLRRRVSKIANIPWGVYRPSGGMEKEALNVEPGVFFPVDDTSTDIRMMNAGNVTTAWVQEEALVQQYADKLTSMPAIMQGALTGPIGPLRSTSGVTSILNEANGPLNVHLDRFRVPFNRLLNSIYVDISRRLPKIIKIQVLGEDGEELYDNEGNLIEEEIDRDLLRGKYRWILSANDAHFNPEKDRQNAQVMAQTLLSPLLMQMGITTPQTAYNVMSNLLKKNGEIEINKYINKPQDILQPLTLMEEWTTILNGRMPIIVLNDDHAAKIMGYMKMVQAPEFTSAVEQGLVSPVILGLLDQAILNHKKFQQMIETAQPPPNQEGQQVASTLGATSAGVSPQQQPQAPGEIAPPEASAIPEEATPEGGMNGE